MELLIKSKVFIVKYLNQFQKFAADPFFAGKVLTVTGTREWLDHETKAKLGWIVDTVITVDNTPYTLDVYGHVTEEMKRASAERMEKFIQSVSGA